MLKHECTSHNIPDIIFHNLRASEMCFISTIRRLPWRGEILLQHVEVDWLPHVARSGDRRDDHSRIHDTAVGGEAKKRTGLGCTLYNGGYCCRAAGGKYVINGTLNYFFREYA